MTQRKPSVPKGTRDFPPGVMTRRNYIFNVITRQFRLCGYQPIETPAMEQLSTLTGKYGEEGDKLLYRVLNSGDFLSPYRDREQGTSAKPVINMLEEDPSVLARMICERGLRYDLTVPFARYVVQHRNELVFPFKRYQVQPVWRADKPQKGRYREFYQCDADVIGSDSLLNERELIGIALDIFEELGISCNIRLNNRKILAGLAAAMGEPHRIGEITTAVDKLEKIGRQGVLKELHEKGIGAEGIDRLLSLLDLRGDNRDVLEGIRRVFPGSVEASGGAHEMEELLDLCEELGTGRIRFDVSLARGLDYYTGTIIEVSAEDGEVGSICGGGRYDDLTGVFGMPGISGVGISFGADRIYDHMERLNLFPADTGESPALLFVNFGEKREKAILKMLSETRKKGIVCEFYPDAARLKKQLSYANSRQIPYVAIIGEEEEGKGLITLKDMQSGNQQAITFEELIAAISSK